MKFPIKILALDIIAASFIFSLAFTSFAGEAAAQNVYGCIDNVNAKYVCFGQNQGPCMNTCQPPLHGPCVRINPTRCGQVAPTPVPTGGGGGGGGGSNIPPGTGKLGFSINLQPPSRFGNIGELVNAMSQYLLQIAIPLGVLMIIYAGIRFILARGNPGEVSKAKSILWYVLLGLAIVIIGVGFINLITSFLGQPSTSP